MLAAAGWAVQDRKAVNLSASKGVAIREFSLEAGFADYMLFVDRQAVGIVEAKKEGTSLSGVDTQSQKYLDGFPPYVQRVGTPLPFAYESTGVETVFRDVRDPDYRSRRVFAFHCPETLLGWAREPDTLRARLKKMPPLARVGLRECQVEAIEGLEHSLSENRPRSLIQMATGSGKTFTAVSFAYRLIKHAGAGRVLFLVDRANLGRQTLKEFQQYATPDDGRKFTELYNVQHLAGGGIDPVSKVCISTIQRLYSMLRGEELDESLDEASLNEITSISERPKEVSYNPQIPIETFDFVVMDECHRSIYNVWRQVLEYFDAYLIGLTATPSKQTFGFFDQNLVMEYNHERAVADGVNVDYVVYRIKTEIGEQGGQVDAGFYVDYRDKATREVRWSQLEETLEYTAQDLDRSVVVRDQIRTVIRAYKDRLFTDLFPKREVVPKTLIFAKDDSHAEDIVPYVSGVLVLCAGNVAKGANVAKFAKVRGVALFVPHVWQAPSPGAVALLLGPYPKHLLGPPECSLRDLCLTSTLLDRLGRHRGSGEFRGKELLGLRKRRLLLLVFWDPQELRGRRLREALVGDLRRSVLRRLDLVREAPRWKREVVLLASQHPQFFRVWVWTHHHSRTGRSYDSDTASAPVQWVSALRLVEMAH